MEFLEMLKEINIDRNNRIGRSRSWERNTYLYILHDGAVRMRIGARVTPALLDAQDYFATDYEVSTEPTIQGIHR